MRFIVRTFPLPSDHAFERWRLASLPGVRYCDLADGWRVDDTVVNPKTALLVTLIATQGELCAWVGDRISVDSAHIDHVEPRSKNPSKELEPQNMVAASPKHADVQRPWGAHTKLNEWREDMVRPNDATCEGRIAYSLSGRVSPRSLDDDAAAWTINVLALDHRLLTTLRRKAIRGFRLKQTWKADLAGLSARMRHENPGRLVEFAPAIVDSLSQ
jgi:uncharacterized protein (TIGR02646 family)